jgi:hypothetical protein
MVFRTVKRLLWALVVCRTVQRLLWLVRRLVGGCRRLVRLWWLLWRYDGLVEVVDALVLRLEALGRGDDACRGSGGVATACWRLSTLAEAMWRCDGLLEAVDGVVLRLEALGRGDDAYRGLWRCDGLLEAVDACRGSCGVATACWRLSTLAEALVALRWPVGGCRRFGASSGGSRKRRRGERGAFRWLEGVVRCCWGCCAKGLASRRGGGSCYGY